MNIAIIWDNFGPLHVDRCNAVAALFHGRAKVFGLELFDRSVVYGWLPSEGLQFEKVSVNKGRPRAEVSQWSLANGILRELHRVNATHVVTCHYDRVGVFAAAWLSKLAGRHVFTMGCSKFDDCQRYAPREHLKRVFFTPYEGAIAGGSRSANYFAFQGINSERIFLGYNTVSHDRLRRMSSSPGSLRHSTYEERHFTIVARFVPKKNVAMAIEAFATYAKASSAPRRLVIMGGGPLEQEFRALIRSHGIEALVDLHNFVQTNEVATMLSSTLALILPSVEEQFGNVVSEALAMAVPILATRECGATDELVRSGKNGFVIDSDSPVGLARLMDIVARDHGLWKSFVEGSRELAPLADSGRFALAVERLVVPSIV